MSLAMTSALRGLYDGIRGVARDCSAQGRETTRRRDAVERMLDQMARSAPERFDGAVLVDGMFDNPNFWFRYSLLRTALGLAHGREVGLLGPFRNRQCRRTFAALGIKDVRRYPDLPVSGGNRAAARDLLARTRAAEDILTWRLPGNVPAAMIYDGILKRQRLAAVDVGHPDFEAHVTEALDSIERSRRLLDSEDFKLVTVSHPFNFSWGSLAWQALERKIPVILPFGLFGVLRFAHMTRPDLLFAFYDRPSREEMDALPPHRAEAMAEIGRAYLAGRFGGKADDLASVYAYQRNQGHIDRAGMCERYGWDPAKPIVAVYASNWYDWPHQLGMSQFRDFLDWTEASFAAARGNDGVNWLFKPHPCEDWFGGIALADIMAGMGRAPHVAVAEKSWNNAEVMLAADALVTYHGTAGIEFASLGKPVMVPDRGKYDDCGFVKVAQSRAHYLEMLGGRWWDGMDMADVTRRAEIFAGWWFCAPDWQGKFVIPDDSQQDKIYGQIPSLLNENGPAVEKELHHLRIWFASGHPYSHTYKMLQAERYQLSNLG